MELITPDHPFTNLILLIEFDPHMRTAYYDDPHFVDHLPALLKGEGFAPITLTASQRELLMKRPPEYPWPTPGEVNHEIDKEFGVADKDKDKGHDSDPVLAVLHVQAFPVRK